MAGEAEFLVKDVMDADLAALFNAGEGHGAMMEMLFASVAVGIQNMRKLSAIEKAMNITDAAPASPVTQADAPPALKLAQSTAAATSAAATTAAQ